MFLTCWKRNNVFKTGALVPSLEMTYVLTELFGVPGGEGRILNIDESMTYRYDQDGKTWTYSRLFTLLLFQET